MTLPRVSVCIPTIPGREALLKEAIASVQASTERNFEICINCDDSIPINENWSKVCRLASAPYIFKMDSDDLIEPDFLKKCCDFLDSCPGVSIVFTGYFYEVHAEYGWAKFEKIDRNYFKNGIVEGRKYHEDILCNRFYPLNHKSAGVFRAKIANLIGFFDHAEVDILFTTWLAEYGDIGYIPEPLYRYRAHGGEHEGMGLRPLRMLITSAKRCYGPEADILIRGTAIRYIADSFLHGRGLVTIKEVLRLEPRLKFSLFFWLSITVIFCLPEKTYLNLLDWYIETKWIKRLTNIFIRA